MPQLQVASTNALSSAALVIPELLGHILQFVPDKITHKHCSLVSRLWDDVASPYLFYSVALDPTENTLLPSGTIQPSYSYLSGCQRVVANAKKISIVGFKYSSGLGQTGIHRLPVPLLADIIYLFPRMSELHIKGLVHFSMKVGPQLSSYPFQSPTPMSRQLDKLVIHLDRMTFAEASLSTVLIPFVRIKVLELTPAPYESGVSRPILPKTSLASWTKVDRLELWSCDGFYEAPLASLCRLIASNIDTSSIISLRLEQYLPSTSIRPINDFLQSHVPNLESFTFKLSHTSALDDDIAAPQDQPGKYGVLKPNLSAERH